MLGKSSIKKSSQLTLDVSSLQEFVVELDEQKEERLLGGTSFTGEKRLRTRFFVSSLTSELETLDEGAASVASQYGIRSIPTLMIFNGY